MRQLQSLISTIVASAIECAGRGGGDADVVHGLVAGLRRLRTVVAAQAGYGAACALEDSIHAVFVDRTMQAAERSPRVLPPQTVHTRRAVQILEDSAMSCLALNAFFPGNTSIGFAVQVLAGRLVDRLGGVPDWLVILSVLRSDDSDSDGDGDEGEDPWVVPAVH